MERSRHPSILEQLLDADIPLFTEVPVGWKVIDDPVRVRPLITAQTNEVEFSSSEDEPHASSYDELLGRGNWGAVLIISTMGMPNESFVTIVGVRLPKGGRYASNGMWLRLVK